MVRRAQISLEFLMITAIALILMTGATYVLFQYTQSSSDTNALQQSAQVGYRLVDEATNMYVYGEDSFVTVGANLPQEISSIYVVENDTLVFELITSKGIVPVQVFSTIPINGSTRSGERVYVNDTGSSVSPGNTQFRVTSRGSWVEIELRT